VGGVSARADRQRRLYIYRFSQRRLPLSTARSLAIYVGIYTLAGASETIYTVPAGMTLLVKSLYIFNGASTPQPANVQHQTSAGTAGVIAFSGSIAADEIFSPPIWAVLEPGDQLTIYAGEGSANVLFAIYGALLTGTAE
jgi:hypothetical protein